jgi:hypothetical protein
MRKFLFAALLSTALVVAMPATALARHHHRHHHQVRHEKFGSATGTTTTTSGATMSSEEGTAGTVDSFTNGVLTIRLNDGTTLVSGMVTDATELKCDVPENEVNDNDADDITSGDHTAMEDGGSSGGDNTSGSDDGSGDTNQGEPACTTAALTPGTVVQEAELNISSAGAVWHEVELVTP